MKNVMIKKIKLMELFMECPKCGRTLRIIGDKRLDYNRYKKYKCDNCNEITELVINIKLNKVVKVNHYIDRK